MPDLSELSKFASGMVRGHGAVVQAATAVRSLVPEVKVAFLVDPPLEFLERYAKEKAAKRLDAGLGNFGCLKHADRNSNDVKDEWATGAWAFGHGLAAVNGVYFVEEYEDFAGASYSLVISKSKEDAISFLKGYDESNWKKRHSERCILDHDGEPIESFREMDWKNIFLDGGMVEQIHSEIETFFCSKQTYKECGLDWRRGIILAGRAGNGKTAIIRALATTATVPVVFCIPDEGDTFGMLNRLDRTIRTAAPCIVVVEDIDSIGSNEATRSKLLNMFDGLVTSDGVLTIASTNNPDKLDEAFTGRPSRFDSYYVLDVPPLRQRKSILENKLGKRLKRVPKDALAALLKEMSGLSAAFVQEVAVCSLMEEVKTGKPISIAVLKASLRKVKKHMGVSEGGLEKAVKGSAGFAARELW